MVILLLLLSLQSVLKPPPGTIKVKDYFVDRREILNINWLELLYYQKKELDSVEYIKLLPDSANIVYQQPQYRYMPIVLIDYHQAQAYCKWRSRMVSKKMDMKVKYRLMTPEEYQEIARELISKNRKRHEKSLAKTWEIISKFPDSYKVMETFTFHGPKNRIYHFFDNVSEMTSIEGVAMGANNGNLTHLTDNLERVIHYDQPHSYLGFRCIAEFEEQ